MMRFVDGRVILCAVGLGGLFSGCPIGPSAWPPECGEELQECCGDGACNNGLDCASGRCAAIQPQDAGPITACGEAGQECCKSGRECGGILTCQASTCQAPIACGGVDQQCCSTGPECEGVLTCQASTCRSPLACGDTGQLCCPTSPPCKGVLTCQTGACRAPPACGRTGQTCCASGLPCGEPLTCQAGICRYPPLPDLIVDGFSFVHFTPSSNDGLLRVCLNVNAEGTPIDNSNFLRVGNIGKVDSPPFEVEVGIVGISGEQSFQCPFRFPAPDGLAAGSTGTTKGPICCGIDLTYVPAAYYKVYALVDPADKVVEEREDNNRVEATGQFYVP